MTTSPSDAGKPVDPMAALDAALAKLGTAPAATTATSYTQAVTNVYAPTESKSIINKVFQTVLGRDATPKELKAFQSQLTAAEKANPTQTVYNKVDGKVTTSTTGGINREQFLTDAIYTNTALQKEILAAQEKAAASVEQSIANVAMANGLSLSPDQIKAYASRVKSKTDFNDVQKDIRAIAAKGMPDDIKQLMLSGTDLMTVYSPYRQRMATVLEVPEDQININDKMLRSAISKDGEMTMYDFERALRQDPRWQYTDNARQEVSSVALKVLKDFGFQG